MTDLSLVAIGGIWTNSEGSNVVFSGQGTPLTGHYKTAVGAADTEKSYPLTGFRNGPCVSFTVSWAPDSASMTAWTGLLVMRDDLELHTVWTLVRSKTVVKSGEEFEERATAPWQAFSVQSSIFRRI